MSAQLFNGGTPRPATPVEMNSLKRGVPASPIRFTLAQRASVEGYPPVLHQAALLRALGSVRVLDAPGRGANLAMQTDPQIERIRIPAVSSGTRNTSLSRLKWAIQYAREFRRQLAVAPDVAIAYEPDSAALLLLRGVARARTMRIVHLHEIPDKTLYSPSMSSSIAIRYMLANLKRADLVIVPDDDRAAYTTEVGKLTCPPTVVLNCPLTLMELPVSKLLPWLQERGAHAARIVHFQGSLGPDHALAKVIASMRFWPADAIFVIVGDGPPAYLEELRALAGREKVLPRVLFVGRVPYADVFSYAVGATVGVTLLEPHNKNWKFAAGASNKRFEYPALGIPQVTNGGAGMDALFGKTGIAEVVDANSVEAIGRAIAHFLLDPTHASNVGDKARGLHLHLYNYECQFAPVIEQMQRWTSASPREVRS